MIRDKNMKYRMVVHLFFRPVGSNAILRDMAEFVINSKLSDSLSSQIDDKIKDAEGKFRDRMKPKLCDLVSTDTMFCQKAE